MITIIMFLGFGINRQYVTYSGHMLANQLSFKAMHACMPMFVFLISLMRITKLLMLFQIWFLRLGPPSVFAVIILTR